MRMNENPSASEITLQRHDTTANNATSQCSVRNQIINLMLSLFSLKSELVLTQSVDQQTLLAMQHSDIQPQLLFLISQ